MQGHPMLVALAAIGMAAAAHAAPFADEGNFTSRDCALGGGFIYCNDAAPSGYAPGGMTYGLPYGQPALPGSGASIAPPGAGQGIGGSTPGIGDVAGSGDQGGGPSTGWPDDPITPPSGLPGGDTADNGGSLPVIAVPEPGALALLGAALGFLGIVRRRAIR